MKRRTPRELAIVVALALGCSGGGASGGNSGSSGGGGNGGTSTTAGMGGDTGGAAGKGGGGGMGGTLGTGGTAGGAGSGHATGIAGSTGTAGAGGAAGASGTSGASGASGTSGAAGGGSSGIGGAGGAAIATALVDDDQSDNNSSAVNPQASPSDTIFPMLLQNEGVAFHTLVSTSDSTPGASDLAGYTNVIWYTGPATQTLSANQQQALEQWLDTGGKRLVVFSENLALHQCTWTSVTNAFLVTYVGAAGCVYDVYGYVQEAPLSVTSYVVTGVAGTPFDSFTYDVTEQTPIASTADVINPAAGTTTLATVSVDPTYADGDSPTPIAVGHLKGTSTIVYVGLPIEDIAASSIGTRQRFFHATLVYLGVVN